MSIDLIEKQFKKLRQLSSRERNAIVLSSHQNKRLKEIRGLAYVSGFKIKMLGLFTASKSYSKSNSNYSFLGRFEDVNHFIKNNRVDIIFILPSNQLDKAHLLRCLDYRLLKKIKILIEPTLWNPVLDYLKRIDLGRASFFYLSYPLYSFTLKEYLDKLLALTTILLLSINLER